MSDVGVHSFDIPHHHVTPTRDMVIINIPMPPKKIGSIITPDVTRDLLQHNVMAGRICAMGPIAFQYKTADGVARQEANIGDWVLIRPFAGTLMGGVVEAGKVQINSGFRYVSSFQDVIGILPAAAMPNPETLDWGDAKPQTAPPETNAEVKNQPRSSERLIGV